MTTKTQSLLTILFISSLLAINYYVSSTTVKVEFPEVHAKEIGEDKKIDKKITKEIPVPVRKTKPKENPEIGNVIIEQPSLLEISQRLGVPLTTAIEEMELAYPE